MDLHREYADLRRRGPVHHVVDPAGWHLWLVVGYAEARAALADPRLAKEYRGLREAMRRAGAVRDEDLAAVGALTPSMLNSDPPEHRRLRGLVSGAFTPARIERLRPRVQQIADELLDAMAPLEEVDLMEAFAFPLPIIVICELLGIPVGDRDLIRVALDAVFSPGRTEMAPAEGIRRLLRYLAELVAARRRTLPATAPSEHQPDLISALIAAREDDRRLSEEEVLATVRLLLIAGHETTVNLIGNAVTSLFEHPDQLHLLRARPDLVGAAVEEVLRYESPAERTSMRFATEDLTLGGVRIPSGSVVAVAVTAANRDPARIPDPDRFDIERTDQTHIAFGHGIHFCLGAPLARMEGRVAIASLLARFPDLAPADSAAPPRWRTRGRVVRGVESLPVRIRATRS